MTPAPLPGVVALYRRGFASLGRTLRMVFPVYVVNLLVAVFAVLPLYLALHRVTAYRPAAERLLHTWDLEVIGELLMDHPTLLGQLQGTFLFVPVAYLCLSHLLLGGVLGALQRDEKPALRRFGQDAFAQFAPLCWVGVWSLIPYAFAVGVGVAGAVLAEPLGSLGWLWGALPGLVLFLWTDAALDYARAITVQGGVTPSLRRLLWGFGLVLKSPLRAFGVHLGFGVLGMLPLVLLLLLPDGLDAGGTGRLLVAFLIRQVLVFLRTGLRIASLGSHLELARAWRDRVETPLKPRQPA